MVVGILIGMSFIFNNYAPGLAIQSQTTHIYFPLATKPAYLYFPLVEKPLVPTVFGVENTNLESLYGAQTMIQGGATWIRYTVLSWSDLQPNKSVEPDWSSLDVLKEQLSTLYLKQVNIILNVRNTPGWAQKYSGSTCGPISEEEIPAFAQFMHDLVLQLSAPPYNVKYWEIGNEPDTPVRYGSLDYPLGCWGEPKEKYYGGEYYAEMLKQVYPAIKLADSNAKVLIGGLLLNCDPDNPVYDSDNKIVDCSPSRFLEGIVSSGGGDYFDAVSYHAYDYFNYPGSYSNSNWNASSYTTGPSSNIRAQFVRSVLAKYGVTDKLLINSETALVCTLTACKDDDKLVRNNYETTKAYYLAVDYASAIANDLTSRIWYDIEGVWRYTGLLNNKTPRPSYYAFQTAATELGYAKYVQDITQFSGIKGYQFIHNNKVIWFLWSIDGNSHTVSLPSTPFNVLDSLGTSVTPALSMTVDINPLYFEWIGNP
jgi:hypothetical protein